jgi:hypothetical protein
MPVNLDVLETQNNQYDMAKEEVEMWEAYRWSYGLSSSILRAIEPSAYS